MSNAVEQVKVGDFMVCSWGYDQTNVDFYKVVGLTPSGKSVRVQQWSKAVESSTGPHDHVVPGDRPAQYTDWSAATAEMSMDEQRAAVVHREVEVETKRLVAGWVRPTIRVNSHSAASLWDGRPRYQTGSGWGH